MDEESRNRIAWALMIAHFKEKGLLISEKLIIDIDTVYAAETGLHPVDVRRFVCHMIMNIGIDLPWGEFGDLTEPKVHGAIWPVFKALVARRLDMRTRSTTEILQALLRADRNTLPALAQRANLSTDDCVQVLTLATTEIMAERRPRPARARLPDDNTST